MSRMRETRDAGCQAGQSPVSVLFGIENDGDDLQIANRESQIVMS